MRPVRIDSGVHFGFASFGDVLDDAVALFARVEWICRTLVTAARGCNAQNLSMAHDGGGREREWMGACHQKCSVPLAAGRITPLLRSFNWTTCSF